MRLSQRDQGGHPRLGDSHHDSWILRDLLLLLLFPFDKGTESVHALRPRVQVKADGEQEDNRFQRRKDTPCNRKPQGYLWRSQAQERVRSTRCADRNDSLAGYQRYKQRPGVSEAQRSIPELGRG